MHFSSVPYMLCATNAVYNSRTGGCVSEWPCPKVCDTASALQWGGVYSAYLFSILY